MAEIADKEKAGAGSAIFEKGSILEFIDQIEEISQLQSKIDIRSNIDHIWKVFLNEIKNSIKIDGCALFMVDEESHEFILTNAFPIAIADSCQSEIEHQIECGMFSWILNRQKPALLPSMVFKNNKTIIMLPLVTAKQTLGVVLIITAIEESSFTQENMKLMAILAKQCSLVMENSLLYDRLKKEHEELKKAQNQILQAEKLASIGRLTAGASHEILNPLNIISGYIQMLLMKADLDERKIKYLNVMSEQVERISKIVNGLYQFSRISGSEKENVNINDLIRNVIQLFEHEDRYANITKVLELVDDLPVLKANTNNLKQVFFIMLSNARDAMPKGGELRVSTKFVPAGTEDSDGWVEIKFQDTGLGIPEEVIDKIFDPFFTTKASKNETGLGLSLSYGVIQDHGGSIRVQSQLNKGTTFTIRLPASASAP